MLRWFHRFQLRFRSLFRSQLVEQELSEELRFHLEKLVEQGLAKGMTPEEARYAALRELGCVEQIKEECRDMRRVSYIENLFQDVRYGLRMLAKNAGFATVAVLTMALGIGVNTTIFSFIDGVLLRPLPYKDPDHLAILWTESSKAGIHEEGSSYPNFQDWRAQNHVFEDMAFFTQAEDVTLSGKEEAEQVQVALCSANFFPLLGVPPMLGRTFSSDEVEHHDRVVVLSNRLWQTRFGASLDSIGKTLEVDGKNYEVIGVMPEEFQFPTKDTRLWGPITLHRFWDKVIKPGRYHDWLVVIGRLKPHVTFQQAQAEMSAIGHRLEQAYPKSDRDPEFAGFGIKVVPLMVQITGRSLPLTLWILFGAVVFVLLIACTNVANLLLARGVAREREFAIRTALGGGRARLVRQLLTESVLLSLASGLLGLLLALLGMRVSIALAPRDIPRLDAVGINARVLAFTWVVALLTGILFGLAPAWEVSRSDPNESLKEGSSKGALGGLGNRRLSGLLVVVEVAFAVVLLFGSGLLIRSFLRLLAVDPGFRAEHVLILRVSLSKSKTIPQIANFYQQALEHVKGAPGVRSAGLIGDIFQRRNPDLVVNVEGHSPRENEPVSNDAVSPGLFQALGVPLLRGRYFSEQDGPNSAPVAIINDTMARHFWSGEDAIGRRFNNISVVGIVGDMRSQGLEKRPISQYFVPYTQDDSLQMYDMELVVRSDVDPLRLAVAVGGEIRLLDETVFLHDVTTLEDRMREGMSQRRFQTTLLGFLAAVALLLAAVGIYGVMHYSVSQRTHEIGIRMALGARAEDVLLMILRRGLILTLIGVTTGLIGALWLTETMSSLLFGVTSTDPVTFAFTSVLLTAVALLASYVPARRATRVDPVVALRHE